MLTTVGYTPPRRIRRSVPLRFASRLGVIALLSAAMLAGCDKSSSSGTPKVSPGIGLSTTSLVTAEGGPNVPFSVRLLTAPTSDVDVDLYVSDPTEGLLLDSGGYSLSYGVTLTFAPTDWNVPQTVQVVPQDDNVTDGNQTYTVTASISWTTDATYMSVPARTISVTNSDNDIPGITVSKTTATTSEAPTTDTFTVRLNTAPTATVTIPVTSTDTSEGLLRGGDSPTTSQPTINLTFTASNWSSPQTVTIYGIGDLIDDGNQTYNVRVGPPTGAAEYRSLTAQNVSVTNIDDDTAGITVTASSSPLVTSENGTTATFTVRLNTEPVANVVIPVTSGNVAEGLLSAGVENHVDVAHLTFTATDWSTPQTVTVTGQDEVGTQVPGDNVTYDVRVGPATGDPTYAALASQAVHVLNTDNDAAAVIVPAAGGSPLQTQETGAGNTTSFTIGINKLPATNVVIPVTVSDVTEGLVQGGSSPSVPAQTVNVTFTPADFMTAQTITVVGQVDNLVDGPQTYTITIGTPAGDSAYTSLAPQTVSVVNADSDVAGFTVSKTSLTTAEGGAVNTFTVVLNRAPSADVVIPVSSGNAAEGLLAGGSSGGTFVTTLNLTFTSINWSTPQTVQVKGPLDSIDDGDKTYTITVGPTASSSVPYNALSAKTVSATNYDVDVAGFTVTPLSGLVTTEAGGTATFTVKLNTIPTGTVTVPVSVDDTTEALVSTGGGAAMSFVYLYFTSSNWSTPQTVTVHGVDDFVADGTVPYAVSVGPTTSSDTKYSGLAAKAVSGATTDDDATNQGAAITPINVTGLLPYASQVGSGSSYYVLTGVAAGSVTVTLSGVHGDVSLALYSNANFSSGLLCSSANVGTTASESCTGTLPASGSVYILVSAAASTSGAVFTIGQGPATATESEPNDTIATADGPFSSDVTISGALPTYSELDYYAITNAGATAASVTMETFTGSVGACSYDTVIELYTAGGSFLASNDDSGVNLCSYLSYSIPAGTTYYLKVRGFAGNIIPSYLLQLNFP